MAAVFGLSITCLGQASAPAYLITPLGTLDNPGSSTVLRQVNSLGEAAGGFKNKDPKKTSASFLLSAAAGFNDVTSDQTTDYSVLYGINDNGEVAGAINGASTLLPFRAVRHTGFQFLTLPPGDTGGAGLAINDNGESAGYTTGVNGAHAVWWTQKGAVQQLGSLADSSTTRALHINKKGDIVGTSGDVVKHAMLWAGKGSPFQLQAPAGFTDSEAVSINAKGDIAGFASAYVPPTVQSHALLWSANGQSLTDLGTFPGGMTSRARDISDTGQIVGTGSTPNGNRAFLWTAATGMVDLNSLVSAPTLILMDAVSINKQGVILAIALDASAIPPGQGNDVEEHELPRHIVLLTPTK